MYEEFYGLKEKPFNLTPDPKFLFLSTRHREALEHLAYGVANKEGFILFTGDIGTGKTTLCRAFLERSNRNLKTAAIFNSFLTEEELLESILLDFGFPSKGRSRKERIDALNKFLIYQLSQGGNAVLVIDEAQNLSISVLEQVRMLSNLETEKEKLLQIVLIGQVELREKIRLPQLKQLEQRISVRYHLQPLIKSEVSKYIYHRLMVAGSEGRINFSRGALRNIYRSSKGIPRLINLICDRALLNGYAKGKYTITTPMVLQAIKSLRGEEKALSLHSKIKLAISLGAILFLLLGLGFFLSTIFHDKPVRAPFPTSPIQKPSSEAPKPTPKVEAYRFDPSFPYIILIDSFSTEELAIEAIRKLEPFSGPKNISKISLPGGGSSYRVLIGRFKTQAEAYDLLIKLKAKTGFDNAKIMEVLPEGS
ncbi:MAG: AAA family ATPase [Deltaproteobacteria bacterium]